MSSVLRCKMVTFLLIITMVYSACAAGSSLSDQVHQSMYVQLYKPRTINMIKLLIHVATLPLWVSGSSLSDQVDQSPPALYKNQGESAKINCSHSIPNYNRILWYKQDEHRRLMLLGYMLIKSPYPETGHNITLDGDANKGGLCLKQPPEVLVELGKTVSLSCEQENTSKTVMFWYQYRGRGCQRPT
ncbi:hypothetical protein UPYG_G00227770 [Umbra pygmaea]|uniref:Ig-like domain-containing protein n=1 Tax=Umbra pygmaea TaxID=75934 RepID=A0ABD0WX69_UMBPY